MKTFFSAILIVGMILTVWTAGMAGPTGDPAAGQAVFHKNCTVCHGAHADGKGPAAAGLSPAPRNLTDPAFMKAKTDDQLEHSIKEGIPNSAMAGWKSKLSDAQILDVVAYLRSLSR